MIRFDIITIFPDIFDSYLQESLIARAHKKKLIQVRIHNLRDWTFDRHKTVDDRPFGGGIGMVMKVEPIYKAVQSLKSRSRNSKSKIKKSTTILFTPRGKKFDQKMAYRFSKLDQLIMICGRYEGVDERVARYIAQEEVSIGDYVVMGGELAAMVVIEAVARLIPGVLGKAKLLEERITKKGGFIEYPEYTRPEVFSPKKGVYWKTPRVLLSGNHKKIEEWKKKHGREIGG
jgi:tRNA (guanine37-N1)-methyltransferase